MLVFFAPSPLHASSCAQSVTHLTGFVLLPPCLSRSSFRPQPRRPSFRLRLMQRTINRVNFHGIPCGHSNSCASVPSLYPSFSYPDSDVRFFLAVATPPFRHARGLTAGLNEIAATLNTAARDLPGPHPRALSGKVIKTHLENIIAKRLADERIYKTGTDEQHGELEQLLDDYISMQDDWEVRFHDLLAPSYRSRMRRTRRPIRRRRRSSARKKPR